jgi:hypothetical protein
MRVRTFFHFALFVVVFVVAIAGVRIHVVRATADEAQKFAPLHIAPVLIPGGTAMPAVVLDGIPRSAAPGDNIAAILTSPVVVGGRHVISPGARLSGLMKEVSVSRGTAKVSIDFTVLLVDAHAFTIRARPTDAVLPVLGELGMLTSTFRTFMGATLGATLGAGSEDARAINWGLVAGVQPLESDDSQIPITVYLAQDLVISSRF